MQPMTDNSKLSPQEIPYKEIANDFSAYRDWESKLPDVLGGFMRGKVVSKGRARVSANGHVYTPEKTRAYEKLVTRWASNLYLGRPVFYPVMVIISIYDKTTEPLLLENLTSKQTGDIDNKAKAILDACNNVIWRDDKQINQLSIYRKYGPDDGFYMRVRRSGLSKFEVDNLRKHIKAAK